MRKLSVIALFLWVPLLAQTSLVELPENPPDNFLYQANHGNLFFNNYQSEEISQDLQQFAKETEYAVYLVTVNSPAPFVFDHLRQQTKVKWARNRDCMIVFYDLDTRALVVEYEPYYFTKDDLLCSSKFFAVQDQTWIGFIDHWLSEHEQAQGVELDKLPLFIKDYLQFLRVELADEPMRSSPMWGLFAGFLGLMFCGFLAFHYGQKRMKRRVCYYFPSLRMNYRLQARYGGGVISAKDFSEHSARAS